MSSDAEKFYISSALPYVNAEPHIGFALEIVQADVLARYHRLLGEDVFFVTGTDENALKNVQAAQEEGIAVRDFVDRNAETFRGLKEILNISNDDFIRTTEKRHIEGAKKLWKACEKDIYKSKYHGLYCVGCEEFYKESELIDGLCPEHKTKPDLVEEENYFFKLPNYSKELKGIIEKDELKIVPETRKNETLSFINSGLQDFCISRSSKRAQGWGVDVPGDPSQKLWVWFDALSNYINALGYAEDSEKFKEFWQKNDNILHCIGKGILRFHTIYWPAMLLSAGLSLPKTIFVHGYLTVEGEKMSKTLRNVVSPKELVEKYGSTRASTELSRMSSPQAGTDPVRYYLLREISPVEDGDFSYKKFEERYNADLANGLGNLVARVLTLAVKTNPKSQTPNHKQITNPKTQTIIKETWDKYHKSLEEFKFNEALEAVWGLVSFSNEFIDKERPWEKKGEGQSLILNSLFIILSNIAHMLRPFLPETSDKIFEQLGIDPESEKEQEFKIKKTEPLFPRL